MRSAWPKRSVHWNEKTIGSPAGSLAWPLTRTRLVCALDSSQRRTASVHVHLGFNLPLVVDGIVGNNTWGRLDPPEIKKNAAQHNYVRLCQLTLKSFAVPAFDPGPADGIFGPNTEAAVKAFQAIFATPADGIVGPKTWRALRS